ncbi:MAG: hypothetical protein ABLQ96_03720, partial [Candidatus Acidiferrum sp.]
MQWELRCCSNGQLPKALFLEKSAGKDRFQILRCDREQTNSWIQCRDLDLQGRNAAFSCAENHENSTPGLGSS